MKKQILITLTSVFVGAAPFVQYTAALADEASQQENINPITTPEQFIESYCSIKIDPITNTPILDSAQNPTIKLIESANQDNYKMILEGNALFQTMTPDFQAQVRTLYTQQLEQISSENPDPSLAKANSYDDLVAQANQIHEAVLAESKNESELAGQESNSALENQEADPSSSTVQDSQSPLNSETNGQGDEGKESEEIQNQVQSEPSAEKPEEAEIQAEKIEEQENPDVLPEESEPSSEPSVIPSIPPLSQPNLMPEPQILMASAGPGLNESEAPQATTSSDLQENSNQREVQPALEEVNEQKIEEVPLSLSDLSQPVHEVASLEPVQIEAVPVSNPVPVQTSGSNSDSSLISDFILDYVSDSYGNQYYSATQNNATRILSGMGSWSALSSVQRGQINAQLRANGGKSYQALVQEAQRISLSSYSSVSARPVVRTSVNTHASLYAVVCAFSLFLIGWIVKRRKSIR